MHHNHYQLLGVEYDSGFKAVKKAYFAKAKTCHPDLFDNCRIKEEEFKRVVMAFDVLSDPVKRKRYDERLGLNSIKEAPDEPLSAPDRLARFSILDTEADDILEELIVGNNPPKDAHLSTLFLDLERTNVFITFREGKNLFHQRKYKAAESCFKKAVKLSPNNILYQCYAARSMAFQNHLAAAVKYYKTAIAIGKRRIPPQRLTRIHQELLTVRRRRLAWMAGLANHLFPSPGGKVFISPADDMIDETNRAIAKLERERAGQAKRLKAGGS